jgi:hypothetical protein
MKEQIASYIGLGVLLALVVRYPDVLAKGASAFAVGASDVIGGGIGGILGAPRPR